MGYWVAFGVFAVAMLLASQTALAQIDVVSIREGKSGGEPRVFLELLNSGDEAVGDIKTFVDGELVYTVGLKPGEKVVEAVPYGGNLSASDIRLEYAGKDVDVAEPSRKGETVRGERVKSVSDSRPPLFLPWYVYLVIGVVVAVLAFLLYPTRRRK